MTNEWVKVELYGANNDGTPRRYTIASGAVVPKGTLLQLVDPRTASLMGVVATPACVPCAGVAIEEHDGTDYSTSIACWTDGVFEVVASGTIVIGAPICSASGAINTVMNPNTASKRASGAELLGYALEAFGDGETGNMRLKL